MGKQPLYAYRAAVYLEKVQSFPCDDCEVKEKVVLAKREKFPIFPFPDSMNERDARCIFYCTHRLILVLLNRDELLYKAAIGRLIPNPDYEPPSIEKIYQRATAPSKEEAIATVK